jgi:hypothetical protein
MLRKTVLVIAATSVIAAGALSPSVASAKGFGWCGGAVGLGVGLGVLGASMAASAANQSCLQERLVMTPRGYYKRAIVNVCGYAY